MKAKWKQSTFSIFFGRWHILLFTLLFLLIFCFDILNVANQNYSNGFKNTAVAGIGLVAVLIFSRRLVYDIIIDYDAKKIIARYCTTGSLVTLDLEKVDIELTGHFHLDDGDSKVRILSDKLAFDLLGILPNDTTLLVHGFFGRYKERQFRRIYDIILPAELGKLYPPSVNDNNKLKYFYITD